MSLLVTGSIGIDTVEAPSGIAEETLGGSAIYFAYAASFFTHEPVRLVGVVGDDCPTGFLQPLEENDNIDLGGVEVREGSKTFRWHGKYHEDVNLRDTLSVDLGVLGEKGPSIPENFRDSEYVFLANTHPNLQMELLSQCASPALVVADTMDLWIQTEHEALSTLLEKIDGVVLNDSEAILYTGRHNVIQAGMDILAKVKTFCVIKKGEHGAVLFYDGAAYPMPGYPALDVVDPTGAGDCFAGGMMGFLAAVDEVNADSLRRAMAMGTVTASLELEAFSLNKLQDIQRDDIDARLVEFQNITQI